MKKVDSRYSLVIAVAKRARELAEGEENPLVEVTDECPKYVSTAVRETAAGYIKIVPADDEPVALEDAVYTEYVEEAQEEEE